MMIINREELDRRKVDFSEVTTGQLLSPVHPGEILRDELEFSVLEIILYIVLAKE